jgi:hypothetical protein
MTFPSGQVMVYVPEKVVTIGVMELQVMGRCVDLMSVMVAQSPLPAL